ncbi:PREDICTED: transcription factor PIF1-like isoform X1 [Lupinus angustifolius]|uniref:transcription factor PIF1-like isoform X1 n=1 Tax=Lupinus angustifolius TaxID=3871 RepID=UPI00092F2BEA|nr:PREDICTED: transcription factor PIF1-like isoform X1 [Lupinus angustifolius]XP_019461818.1 PREDICTED: transcription factor PIF1-like isoform X1 [Lupinus angustifolius]
MNHCVPDFDIQMDDEEDYQISHPNKPSMQNDEIMELLWQNGQVVMQRQNQRQIRKLTPAAAAESTGDVIAEGSSSAREIRSSDGEENFHSQNLFMQEDEMASWLHYSIHDEDPAPLDHHNFCTGILYASPNQNGAVDTVVNMAEIQQPPVTVASRPPIPPPRIQNFSHFSKHNMTRVEPALISKAADARESTVVDSCDTVAAGSRMSENVRSSAEHAETGRGSMIAAGKAPATSGGGETGTCDMTVTSSQGGSSGSAEPGQREPALDRKRKGRELEESDFQSEDVDFESPEAKKQVRGSTSTKKSRAAEVHNLSERRRRDRINEKMRALQELIPRCNKSDKASMLDEAIEYLKSLQLQVQMMSMGCGMVPMMFPGIQQYMPPMGMGIGMGMGMEMGMNRPVMPFPNMLVNSALPSANAAAHLGPRFPMPPFHMPHVPAPESSRMQAPNQSDNMLPSVGSAPDSDQSRIPNFGDPYQQYLQLQLMQNQAMNQQNVSKPSTSRDQENPEKHHSEER